ncbi:MAG: hypothetical protein IPJ81_05500 [Chitinophagaceae bacterium]|nr:hypothetical protein [Chitinophagaceae bacterium]
MQRKYIIIIFACIAMFAITRFVNYLGNNSSAVDKAPLLHGKGTVEEIEFIPEHDKEVTRKSGRRMISNTHHIAAAYSIKIHIDEENETGGFHTYDIFGGSKWKVGDKVSVGYKKTKLFFFTSTKIYVEKLTKL